MRTLGIDIETYSSVELSDAGVYAYAESPDFEVLLLGYKWDDEPDVHVIDLTLTRQPNPEQALEVLEALSDPNVLKTAWNAAFERTCLAKALDRPMPPEQWDDTMVRALELGLPGSLAGAGIALGLPEEKLKDPRGKALINYFSKPCKPTKSNSGRTRNLPAHDPDKWKLYIEYNRQDVVTEQAIREMLLKKVQPIESEQRLWCIDQRINDYGVRIDTHMAENIVRYDEQHRIDLQKEAQDITGLGNPNSLVQLKEWLEKRGFPMETVTKDSMETILKQTLPPDVRRVLEIRQALGKTSVAKYSAMLDAVCADERVRGTLQFYGAARTGRWCLTGDHEVLTPNGWTSIEDWNGGQMMCWNISTEQLSFQKCKKLCFDYTGEMIHTSTARIDQTATPEHMIPVLTKNGTWVAKPVIDSFGRRHSVAFTGYRNRCCESGPNWNLRLMIATQADGHFSDDGSLRFHFKKQRKVERLKMLLRKNELPYTEGSASDGATTITVRAKQVPLWLLQFRKKEFDYWLLDMNLDVVFDELPYWDGYWASNNTIQYCTTSKQNADVIQACALCNSFYASMTIRTSRNEKWKPVYVLSIWTSPGRGTVIRHDQETKQPYSGKVYCAETPTGFFLVRRNGKVWVTGNSGRKVQTHNLARNSIEDLDLARQLVCSGDFDDLEMLYGEPAFVFSELVRTAFIPSEGHQFIVADFSAIEARVISWIAEEEWRLEAFRSGKDIYCETASRMYHVPVVKHGENGHLRQKGKVAELACGYGGGIGAMKRMDRSGSIPDEELQSVVNQWRDANPRIVKLWRNCEKAARMAIEDHRNSSRPVRLRHGAIAYYYEDGNLYARLPNGRSICYWDAGIRQDPVTGKDAIVFKSLNTARQWTDEETYSGKLVENLTQAIARDCLAETIKRVTAMGYRIVMHVHDEIIVDAPKSDTGAFERILNAMKERIPWAADLPLNADGYTCDYYRKD